MRLNLVEFAKYHARVAQREDKVPFKERYPLALKNRYEGHLNLGKAENNCLHEMSLVFACMKKNDFETKICDKEIKEFQKCVVAFDKSRKYKKQLQQMDIPTPDTVMYTNAQLTYLLRKYPNV